MLTYNQDNRLARVDDNGFVAEYVYNGLGQRVIKTTAGATTYFHYDFGGRMIAETQGDGSVTLGKEYVYNGKVLLAHVEVETGAVYSFHTNYLGAVHQLTDNSGTVVWEGIYKPFGEAVVNPGSTITNHWRLPGQYYDEETGLYYNYYRYYNPAIGRYLTPDPIGLDGGINRYAYVSNNPVNAIDPYGLTAAAGTGCGLGPGMHPGFWPGNPIHDAAVSSLDSLLRYIFSDKNIMRSVKLAIAISGTGSLIYLNESSESKSEENPNITPGGAAPNGDDDDPFSNLSKRNKKHISKHIDEFRRYDQNWNLDKSIDLGRKIVKPENLISKPGAKQAR